MVAADENKRSLALEWFMVLVWEGFHFWQLKVDAGVPGVDLARTYPVQVVRAG